jgi:mannosyltransferase OCH1-like enzyme
MQLKIPKRIIHVWGGGEHDLSLLSQAAVANVRLLNPDFEYLFFDDNRIDNFIDEHFPEHRSVFLSFRFPIQRYDFFRYLAVYHFGGFYLDLDVFLASSLSQLLDVGCVFPFEELTLYKFLHQQYGMDWEIANFAFGAAAGHPFINAIIMNCVRAQKDPKWAQAMMRSIPRMFREDVYILCTTGPGLVTRTLAEYPEAAKEVRVLFPENVCDAKTWHRFGSYGVHLQEATWRKQKNIVRRRLAAFWESWTRKRLRKESLKLGKTRSLEFKRKV